MCRVESCSHCPALERRIAVLEKRILKLERIILTARFMLERLALWLERVMATARQQALDHRSGVQRSKWVWYRARYDLARFVLGTVVAVISTLSIN